MPNNGPLSALMVSTRGADAYADIILFFLPRKPGPLGPGWRQERRKPRSFSMLGFLPALNDCT